VIDLATLHLKDVLAKRIYAYLPTQLQVTQNWTFLSLKAYQKAMHRVKHTFVFIVMLILHVMLVSIYQGQLSNQPSNVRKE